MRTVYTSNIYYKETFLTSTVLFFIGQTFIILFSKVFVDTEWLMYLGLIFLTQPFFIIRPLYRLKSVIIDENEDTITIHNIITKSTLKISSLKAISYKETSKGLLSKAALISVCDKESRSLDILTVTENAILIASQLSDLNPSIQVYHK